MAAGVEMEKKGRGSDVGEEERERLDELHAAFFTG
jgi:hypothetical protein